MYQRSMQVQRDFVNTHPDYIATEGSPEALKNGEAMRDWVKEHNYAEFDANNLEKAYQDLKKRGILELKSGEAGVTTEEDTTTTERIVPPTESTTQPRSSKKASTVSTKGSRAPVVKTGPTEDELYKMDLGKLRDLANKQMAEQS